MPSRGSHSASPVEDTRRCVTCQRSLLLSQFPVLRGGRTARKCLSCRAGTDNSTQSSSHAAASGLSPSTFFEHVTEYNQRTARTEQSISSLQIQVNSIDGTVSGIGRTVTGLEGKLDSVDATLSSLSSAINRVSTSLVLLAARTAPQRSTSLDNSTPASQPPAVPPSTNPPPATQHSVAPTPAPPPSLEAPPPPQPPTFQPSQAHSDAHPANARLVPLQAPPITVSAPETLGSAPVARPPPPTGLGAESMAFDPQLQAAQSFFFANPGEFSVAAATAFEWVKPELANAAQNDTLEPEDLHKLRHPHGYCGSEVTTKEQAYSFQEGTFQIKTTEQPKRAAFLKAVPNVMAFQQLWLLFIGLRSFGVRHDPSILAGYTMHGYHILTLTTQYRWEAVMAYHLEVHRKRMSGKGQAVQWMEVDTKVHLQVFVNGTSLPPPVAQSALRPVPSRPFAAATRVSPYPSQGGNTNPPFHSATCQRYNARTCTGNCPSGRPHRCSRCNDLHPLPECPQPPGSRSFTGATGSNATQVASAAGAASL